LVDALLIAGTHSCVSGGYFNLGGLEPMPLEAFVQLLLRVTGRGSTALFPFLPTKKQSTLEAFTPPCKVQFCYGLETASLSRRGTCQNGGVLPALSRTLLVAVHAWGRFRAVVQTRGQVLVVRGNAKDHRYDRCRGTAAAAYQRPRCRLRYGLQSRPLLFRGLQDVYGLEIEGNAIELVRKRGFCKIAQASVTEIPFNSGAFDLVFSFDVLQQLPEKLNDQPSAKCIAF